MEQKWVTVLFVSLLIWSTLLALYLSLANPDVWLLFLIGIPLQIMSVLWLVVRIPPKLYYFLDRRKQNKKKKLPHDQSKSSECITDVLQKILLRKMLSLHHPKIPTAIDRPHRRYRYKSIRKYRLNQPKNLLNTLKKSAFIDRLFLFLKSMQFFLKLYYSSLFIRSCSYMPQNTPFFFLRQNQIDRSKTVTASNMPPFKFQYKTLRHNPCKNLIPKYL